MSRSPAVCAALGAALLTPLLGAGCGLFHRPAPLPPAPPPPPLLVVLIMPDLEPIVPPPPQPPPQPPPIVVLPAPLPAPTPAHSRPPAREPEKPAAPAPAPDTPAPQLQVQLTPAQRAEYQRNTQAWLAQARRDLATLNRQPLSGEAAATRAQAAVFVDESQQAIAQGDLARAANLAQKAAVLAASLLAPHL